MSEWTGTIAICRCPCPRFYVRTAERWYSGARRSLWAPCVSDRRHISPSSFLLGLVHRPGAYVLPGLHLSTGGLWWGAGCLMGTTICSCIDALSLRVPPGLWVGRARYRSLCRKTGRAHEWRATRLHSGGQLHRAMHVSRDASVRKTKAPAQPSWGLPILRLFRPVFRRQFLQLPL